MCIYRCIVYNKDALRTSIMYGYVYNIIYVRDFRFYIYQKYEKENNTKEKKKKH